ncbi:(R)-citramalate synthase [hydrothermal vent metagenome]|uniref:(R)-citramalate synthase n=1 Tax=hydrothermal vent metagenome TaxID=652676 RepID=A0A3B0V730_9ZZZZ
MTDKITVYDTTLRDGTQAENFNLSVEDKVRITLKLDELGIDFVEGGWPGSNPTSVQYFEEMKNYSLRHTKVASFGSTRLFSNPASEDANLKALLDSDTPCVTIFGKTWDIHVKVALRISMADNLLIIDESLRYLRPHVEHLFYDAEHFFDGFKTNEDYALNTIATAHEAGADCLILCDTNGGTMPGEMQTIMRQVKEFFKQRGGEVKLGIHAHNDSETAVANSLIAIDEGAVQVQGTMNGYGERCGNANLTSIMPALALKMNRDFTARENLEKLTETARFVNELANLPHNKYQPYVGAAAFAHKGGIHVSAVKRNPLTYEHIKPELVGNCRRVLISDQSGRSNVLHKAKKFGLDLESTDPLVTTILKKLKDLENQGFQYEGAEASFELLMRRAMGTLPVFFELKGFRVLNQKDRGGSYPLAEATIQLEVAGETVHTAALGEGPVNALDNALRKALTCFYPQLAEMSLSDYKVRVLSSEHGTGSRVRVLIESSDHHSQWGTVGVSHDILEASWQALVDAISYKLHKDKISRQDDGQDKTPGC